MTKIKEIKETMKKQSYINEAYDYLNLYLPHRYSKDTQKNLTKDGIDVSISTITNVRNRTNGNERLDILNALLMIAERNKTYLEGVVKIVKPNNHI